MEIAVLYNERCILVMTNTVPFSTQERPDLKYQVIKVSQKL
jgi:hypothetical protein